MKNKIFNFALTMAIISSTFFILTTAVSADIGDTTLKRGMNHPDIATLQEKLGILGFFKGEDYTHYFGDKTYSALIAFQKDSGLKADGIAGKETFDQLRIRIIQTEILPENFEPIKEGDNGDKVVDIQKKLKDIDIYKSEITSFYDHTTISAVMNFQKANALPETGIIDSATFIKLNTIINSKIAARASESRRLINARVVEYTKQFLHAPYRWGASSGKAFDCSGFTVYIMKKFNVNLERTASSQFAGGTRIEKNNLMAGDLVFFTTYKKGPSHVGIYIGDNKFIHASSGAGFVTITDLDANYYKKRYLGARRYNLTESN
jgi:cell wall-associated NlpC family hydrolase